MKITDIREITGLNRVEVTPEELDALKRMPAYARILQHTYNGLEDCYRRITVVDSEAKTNVLRGQILALEAMITILGMPPDLKSGEDGNNAMYDFMDKLEQLKGTNNV